MATAELSIFACFLSAALLQHHLLGDEILAFASVEERCFLFFFFFPSDSSQVFIYFFTFLLFAHDMPQCKVFGIYSVLCSWSSLELWFGA